MVLELTVEWFFGEYRFFRSINVLALVIIHQLWRFFKAKWNLKDHIIKTYLGTYLMLFQIFSSV